ncbi:MAG TPA: type II toxin-antitoxin system prevent-host-death family antitoxin [Stellaceae bacterium]|nr:type II toxin-antitoxin system prevent-host-death family antitoxin [Stellaceae bacterium]
MHEINASEVETQFPRLLDAVEPGETIVITRHGRVIARLVPEAERRRADIRAAIEGIKAFRRGMPKLSVAEIRELIEEGRKH